ncbi:hypothetical protein MXD63_43425, partial [Frankia sp. Cpl3]|nr:hypothetical protein [Frankia sp. Cpl3]
MQAALRHLQRAFVNFWEKRAGPPSFKKKGRALDAATCFRNCFTFRDGRIRLAKQEQPLDIVWSRPLPEGFGEPGEGPRSGVEDPWSDRGPAARS